MKNNKMAIAALLGSSVLLSNNKNKENNRNTKNVVKLPELEYIKGGNHDGLETEVTKNNITLESYDLKNRKVNKGLIGTKTKKNFYFRINDKKRIKITGGPEVRDYQIQYDKIFEEKDKEHQSNFSIKKLRNVEILSKDEIKKYIEANYNCTLNAEDDIELVYYKPSNLNKLIPMYQIGNPKSGLKRDKKIEIDNKEVYRKKNKTGSQKIDIKQNLLGMYFPASFDYQDEEKMGRILDLDIEFLGKVDDDQQKNDKNNDQNHDEDKEQNENKKNKYKYRIKFSASKNLNIDNINFLGNIEIENKEKNGGRYSFTCVGNLEPREQEKSGSNIIINYINKYDISESYVYQYIPKKNAESKKPERIDSVKAPGRISSVKAPGRITPLASSRGHNNEWGIDWGEDVIGGSCYSNYVNYMNDKTSAVNRYQWIKPNAWKNDFWDKDKAGGLDHKYADNVDTSVVIAHGNGHGFDLEGPGPNNGDLTYWEANDGKTWGNKDLEFHAWLSCQVLEEEWTFTDDAGVTQRRQWYERWGPTFNGLHLICGFQTNAFVGTHKHLKYFAENMYTDGKTVRRSWFDAADDDQPDDVEAVVMGPLISNNTDSKGDFKSINATTSGMKRAYWNDKAWGKGGSGKDVTKSSSSGKSSQVIGWWRVVHTV